MKKPRQGSTLAVAAIAIAVVVVICVFAWKNYFGASGKNGNRNALTKVIERGDLLVTVTEDGTLESAANLEVKCQVAGGSSIQWIIKDGTYVEKDEKIVVLEASGLEDQIIAQQNVLETAKASKIQAEADLDVAKISVKEYVEGNFKKELQEAQKEITIAMENLRNAQNSLEHSQKMFRKGYLSKLELESQDFAVKRAQLELDSANTSKEVLEKFTKAKTLEDLDSKVVTAEAKLNSATRSYELEQGKLEKLEAQKKNCVINAPQSGMVVYANQRSRWGQQGASIEEGAPVREQQAIVKLPDLSRMQVNVKVHESKVKMLRPGLRAVIKVQGQTLQGTVKSVANQPEQGGWMSANVQEYSTIVAVDGKQEGLKPGMTAEVQILVTHEKNVLKIPVAAVVEKGGEYLAWVDKDGTYEKRTLLLGPTDENFVVVKDGVVEGEHVVENPRSIIEEARGDSEVESKKSNDVSKFGKEKKSTDDSGQGSQSGSKYKGGSGGNAKGSGDGGKGGSRSSKGGSFDREAFFKQQDKNKDGKISGEEVDERIKRFITFIDKDKDGAISKKEWDDAGKMMSGKGRSGGGGPPRKSP